MQIDRIVAELTTEEKIRMIHGAGLFETGAVERLHIPQLKMSDGPMGVRAEFEKDRWVPAGDGAVSGAFLPRRLPPAGFLPVSPAPRPSASG